MNVNGTIIQNVLIVLRWHMKDVDIMDSLRDVFQLQSVHFSSTVQYSSLVI